MGAIKLDILNKSFTLKKVEDNFLKVSDKACAGVYVFGFNGMEKDDEIKNVTGANYTTDYRAYDAQIARWWSVDPLVRNFPWQSPYVAFDNNPINKTDPRGDAAGEPDKTTKAAKAGVKKANDWVDKNANGNKKKAVCNIGVQGAVESYTGKDVFAGKRAFEIYDMLDEGVEGFEEVAYDLTSDDDKTKLQKSVNEGAFIIGTVKGRVDHVVAFVPGEMEKGGNWNGGGKMPLVMDTGYKGNFEKTAITTVSGKQTVSDMKFYVYKPSLSKTTDKQVIQKSTNSKQSRTHVGFMYKKEVEQMYNDFKNWLNK